MAALRSSYGISSSLAFRSVSSAYPYWCACALRVMYVTCVTLGTFSGGFGLMYVTCVTLRTGSGGFRLVSVPCGVRRRWRRGLWMGRRDFFV